MKLIKTESNQAVHLFQTLGVTERQFKKTQEWYLSAQQDCVANKTNTTSVADEILETTKALKRL